MPRTSPRLLMAGLICAAAHYTLVWADIVHKVGLDAYVSLPEPLNDTVVSSALLVTVLFMVPAALRMNIQVAGCLLRAFDLCGRAVDRSAERSRLALIVFFELLLANLKAMGTEE